MDALAELRTAAHCDRLQLRLDETGTRHYLLGRPVVNGETLEIQLAGGVWLCGIYEWSGVPARWPNLRVPLGDESDVVGEGDDRSTLRRSTAVMVIPPDAILRWPSH